MQEHFHFEDQSRMHFEWAFLLLTTEKAPIFAGWGRLQGMTVFQSFNIACQYRTVNTDAKRMEWSREISWCKPHLRLQKQEGHPCFHFAEKMSKLEYKGFICFKFSTSLSIMARECCKKLEVRNEYSMLLSCSQALIFRIKLQWNRL